MVKAFVGRRSGRSIFGWIPTTYSDIQIQRHIRKSQVVHDSIWCGDFDIDDSGRDRKQSASGTTGDRTHSVIVTGESSSTAAIASEPLI